MRSAHIPLGLFVLWFSNAAGTAAVWAQSPAPVPRETIQFETDRGTWINLDVSPDGKSIVFDLLGDLYALPISGGVARRLTSGTTWNLNPRWTADGKAIIYASDTLGVYTLWRRNGDGTRHRLTGVQRPRGYRSGFITADGSLVVRDPSRGAIIRINKTGAADTLAVAGAGELLSGAALTRDGRTLYFARRDRDGAWHLIAKALPSLSERRVAGGDGALRPELSPDERQIAFARRQDGGTELVLLDMASGNARILVRNITQDESRGGGLDDVVARYAFTPDGTAILFTSGGRIFRTDLRTAETTGIPFRVDVRKQIVPPFRASHRIGSDTMRPRVLRYPAISAGRAFVFEAAGRLYRLDSSGVPHRLTNSPNTVLESAPSFSPDGRTVVFAVWTDGDGYLAVVDAGGGPARRLTNQSGRYLNPVWSPDGRAVAAVRARVEWEGRPIHQAQRSELVVVALDGSVRTLAEIEVSGREFPVPGWSSNEHVVIQRALRPAAVLTQYSIYSDSSADLLVRPAPTIFVPSPDAHFTAIVTQDRVEVEGPPGSTLAAIDMRGDMLPRWANPQTLAFSAGGVFRMFDVNTSGWTDVKPDLKIAAAVPTGRIAFTGARVISMRGDEVLEAHTLLVHRNRIATIAPDSAVNIPPDAHVIDARGLTIIPGLIDTHGHIYGVSEATEQDITDNLVSLGFGVTTVVELSGSSFTMAKGEMVEAGMMIGPRIFSTGPALFGWIGTPPGATIAGADQEVQWRREMGAPLLKEYLHADRQHRQNVIAAARARGLAVAGHSDRDLAYTLTQVADGYTAIEHPIVPTPLQRDVIEFIARSGTIYTPTILIGPRTERITWAAHMSATVDSATITKLRRFGAGIGRSARKIAPPEFARLLSVARDAAAIAQAGGELSIGGEGKSGPALHWCMWVLTYGGLHPLAALRAGTLGGARKIGMERDLGSIEPGKLADFLVLDGNPLERIEDTLRIRWVVHNGWLRDANTLRVLNKQ